MFRVLKKGHKPESVCVLVHTFKRLTCFTVVRRISDKLVPARYEKLEQGGTLIY